jgi:hypothetical protein
MAKAPRSGDHTSFGPFGTGPSYKPGSVAAVIPRPPGGPGHPAHRKTSESAVYFVWR